MNDRAKANKLLEDSGSILLPKYRSLLPVAKPIAVAAVIVAAVATTVTAAIVFVPRLKAKAEPIKPLKSIVAVPIAAALPIVAGIPIAAVPTAAVLMAKGKNICNLKHQENRQIDKSLAFDMFNIAAYVYDEGGHTVAGYSKLDKTELPHELQILYDEHTGILTARKGLKVWIGKKDNNIVISYSGTDIKNPNMLGADIEQLSAPSILYLKSAGLLRLLLQHMPNKTFYVTGHSLGGGLMQFSVTANITDNMQERLHGYGFNSAGLSSTSLRHLHENRLKEAKKSIWIFNTCKDTVSVFGGQLGCITILPKTDKNGHDIKDLKKCMSTYLDAKEASHIFQS